MLATRLNWSRAAVIAVLVALPSAPGIAASQDFCQRALADRPFPNLRNRSQPDERGEFRSIVWRLSFSRLAMLDSISRGLITPTGSYSYHEWFFDSTDIPQEMLERAPEDSSARWSAAFELANLFESGTDGMGFAAASLYRVWRLPAEPAAAFLADPPIGAVARIKAVRALEPHWPTAHFRNAAAAALCVLAANAQGRVLIGQMERVSDFDAFDMDEHQLLSDIIWALGTVEERGGPSPDPIIALLPPQNPLTQKLRRWRVR
jgi:hypothetical protein